MVALFFSLQVQRKSLVFITRSTHPDRCGRSQYDSDTEEEEVADNGGSAHSDPDETTKNEPHMLLPTMGSARVYCYLCKVRNVSK